MSRDANSCDQERTYDNAISSINSRQRRTRPQNAPSSDVKPSTESGTPGLRGTPGIAGMSAWLQQLGHSDSDINNLNIIHVAGTKGKGSTCAFTEAFLRAHGKRTGFPLKTGLYTSPHLLLPEERIRLNSQPLPQSLLSKYYFEIYDRLPQISSELDESKEVVARGPRYLQLWALLAFHVFIREKVDVVIFETHCGGEYDATNIIDKPLVSAISTLGMDHIDMLGPTLENIAWHKGGIFKADATALSAPQEPIAAKVLQQRSEAVSSPVTFVSPEESTIQTLSLGPLVQKTNASLAIAAANAYLSRTTTSDIQLTTSDLKIALATFSWPGRFQSLPDPTHPDSQTWYLDSAHNNMSVTLAAEWFASSTTTSQAPRILIFSHINALRSASALLSTLAISLKENNISIDHVIFSTYDESTNKPTTKPQDTQPESQDPNILEETWRAFDTENERKSEIWQEPTIQGAIARAREIGNRSNGMQTLITGSQHLVGPALRILGWKPKEPEIS